jgi:hypothetical protein
VPGGGSPIGFAAFAAVKATGYTGAAFYLSRAYGFDWTRKKKLLVGLARTGIGIVVGVTFGLSWGLLYGSAQQSGEWWIVAYYALLLPIRMGEWYLLLWLFFDRGQGNRGRMLKYAALGTGLSYGLDFLAVAAALVVPGGMWIC